MRRFWYVAAFMCFFAGNAFAGPTENLAEAVKLIKDGKSSEAVPILNLMATDAAATSMQKASAYYLLSIIETDAPKAIILSNNAIAADPTLERAYARKAELLYGVSQNAEALAAATAGIEAATTAKTINGPMADRLFTVRGKCRRDIGDYTGAIEDFTRLLQNRTAREPKRSRADVLLLRGRSYQLSGQQSKALADYDLALRNPTGLNDAENGMVHEFRAVALAASHQYDAALAALAKAKTHGDQTRRTALDALKDKFGREKTQYEATAETRKNIETAENHLNKGHMDSAKEFFQKALASSANLTDDIKARAYHGLSLAEKDAAKALEMVEKTLGIVPDHTAALVRKGMLLQAAGNCREALGAFAEAQKAPAVPAEAFMGSAECRLAMGDYQKAINDFANAAQRGEPAQRIALRRAYAYIAVNDMEKAAEDLQTAARYETRLDRPSRAMLHYLRGRVQEAAKDYDRAAQSYGRALSYDNAGSYADDATARKQRLDSLRLWSR